MSKRDYYDVLGLEKHASDDDIKAAYRKLASKYHPDKVQGDAEKAAVEVKFKEAKEAYETLSEPEKRAQYDNFGHNAPKSGHGQRGWSTHSTNDLNDAFRSFFGNGNFNEDLFGQTARHPPQQTTHIINISLADAYTGRQLLIDSNVGITIPRGARPGTKFYVNGKFYRIDIQPHFKFKRANDDLLVDLQISAIEAMLGVESILEHLDGAKLQFTIPAGIQPGQIIKLSSKGMKNPETDKIGDMMIRIAITVPRGLSDADIAALKTLSHRESINL